MSVDLCDELSIIVAECAVIWTDSIHIRKTQTAVGFQVRLGLIRLGYVRFDWVKLDLVRLG